MSQFNRVVKVGSCRYRTLRQLESTIYHKFGIYDSQAAISARLRDTAKLAAIGLVKKTNVKRIGDKNVWYYKLCKI